MWPPGGNGVTAVNVDGGLRAVLSGAVFAGSVTPVEKSAHGCLVCHEFVNLIDIDRL